MKSKTINIAGCACYLLVFAIFGACEAQKPTLQPTVLRVGLLPDEDAATLRQRFRPLVAHLTGSLAQEVQLVVPDDYAHLLDMFGSGEVDIAYFGGVTFVTAESRYRAVPLVTRDIDVNFSTYLIARADETGTQVDDFGGRSFAFGSELSTSGHFMPRFFLQELGFVAESFFGSVAFSGAHDKTVVWVRDGQADIGAVNSEVFGAMLRDGRLQEGVLRIVWETPIYTDYVWAIQPGWDEAYVTRLRNAFLALSLQDENHAPILHSVGAGGFLPAVPADFDQLKEILAATPQARSVLEPKTP